MEVVRRNILFCVYISLLIHYFWYFLKKIWIKGTMLPCEFHFTLFPHSLFHLTFTDCLLCPEDLQCEECHSYNSEKKILLCSVCICSLYMHMPRIYHDAMCSLLACMSVPKGVWILEQIFYTSISIIHAFT